MNVKLNELIYCHTLITKKKIPKRITTLRLLTTDVSCSKKVLEIPESVRHLETKFPVSEKYKCRLYDITVTADKEVWTGGSNGKLKLFDLHGHRTVSIKSECLCICMQIKHILFSDVVNDIF